MRFGYQPKANWSQTSSRTEGKSWSFNRIQILQGPGSSTLLHRSETGAKMVVQPDVASALHHCAAFKSLEAHTDAILRVLPELTPHRDSTLQTLQLVRDRGILESSEEAWTRLTGGTAATLAPAGCRLFITTCDRPSALKRLLGSISKTPLPDCIEGIWIVDDSRRLESERENAAHVKAAQELITAPLTHFNSGSRHKLLEHCQASMSTKSAISWLLDRDKWQGLPTYGIARTVATLLSVGKRAIVVDDDILLEAVAPPVASGSLRLASDNEREAVLYGSLEEMQQHTMLCDKPLLTALLDKLGHTVGHAVATELKHPDALRGFDGAKLARFSPESRFISSQCGYWGDTGTESGTWIFNLPYNSLKKLLASSADIEGRLSARAAWLGHRSPSISLYSNMSCATGLDNTRLLPPYLPAGRGEDLLFGVMTQRIHPESGVYNLGAAVPHLPIDQRDGRNKLKSLNVIPGQDLLTDWIGREPVDQWGLSPERRLRGMTEEIRRLAEMDSTAIEQLASQLLISKVSQRLQRCVTHLEQLGGTESLPGTPMWKDFLEQSRDNLVAQIQAAENAPLASTGRAWAQNDFSPLRQKGQAFAESLEQWTEMREVASRFTP